MKVTQGKRSAQLTSARGCGGAPSAGGIYLAVKSGFHGIPIWNFLIDNTFVLPDKFGLSNIGMELRLRTDEYGKPVIGRSGKPVYDLWDHIGSDGYPNVADWIMEVGILGFHQKISPNLQFEKLTEESEYIAVHDRAHIIQMLDYYETRQPVIGVLGIDATPLCPYNIDAHCDGTLVMGTCPGLFWEDLRGGEHVDDKHSTRRVKRTMPSFEYEGYSPPVSGVEYCPAAFFKLPIGYMADILVYEDEHSDAHDVALKRLEALEEKLQRVTFIPYDGEMEL